MSTKTLGIPGYLMHKCGLMPKEPNYTVMKDTGADFIATVQKQARKTPGPNHYKDGTLGKGGWVTNGGQFHKGSARRTFTDDAVKHSLTIPGPSAYLKGNQDSRFRIPLGRMDRSETGDFLTAIQTASKKRPGPSSYTPKVSHQNI